MACIDQLQPEATMLDDSEVIIDPADGNIKQNRNTIQWAKPLEIRLMQMVRLKCMHYRAMGDIKLEKEPERWAKFTAFVLEQPEFQGLSKLTKPRQLQEKMKSTMERVKKSLDPRSNLSNNEGELDPFTKEVKLMLEEKDCQESKPSAAELKRRDKAKLDNIEHKSLLSKLSNDSKRKRIDLTNLDDDDSPTLKSLKSSRSSSLKQPCNPFETDEMFLRTVKNVSRLVEEEP